MKLVAKANVFRPRIHTHTHTHSLSLSLSLSLIQSAATPSIQSFPHTHSLNKSSFSLVQTISEGHTSPMLALHSPPSLLSCLLY